MSSIPITLQAGEKQIKILVCCGVKGRIKSFVKHLEGIFVKKGLFDYVFCIGDFFGDDEASEIEWEQFLKSGTSISVPIYTLGPNKIQHEKYFKNLSNQELAPNIFYLGNHGVFSTSDGFKIGYISGIQNRKNEIHTFNYDSLVEFRDSFLRSGKIMDVLLSSPWPSDIHINDFTQDKNIKECPDNDSVSKLMSWIAINVTPRYHFSGMRGLFYERNPYRSSNNRVTRFIGLGNFHDKISKQKWLYGFLLPSKESPSTGPSFTTQSPYSDPSKYTANMLPATKQYFFNTATNSNYRNEGTYKNKKFKGSIKQSVEIKVDSCWFCLSSINISKHMIISIGDQVYLAVTKGPLVKDHILIASIGHYKSFVHIPLEAENEVKMIKNSLNKYFQSTGRVAIFFERNIMTAHFQLQVIPVPISMADRLEHSFKVKFKDYGFNLVEIPQSALLRQITANSTGYFYLELPNGKCLIYNVEKNNKQKFPIHIAREVLSLPSLLNVQDRIDWKKCMQTKSEEELDVKMFREAFKPFNPIKD